jgi:hypothetical protein
MTLLTNQVFDLFNRFRLSIIVFISFFAMVMVLNMALINMPPVWDSVAVFSSAIYLYEHDFDIFGLLRQDGYVNGGPNIHSLSIISFITYLFILLGKGKQEFFFPALHIVQFFFVALVLTCTFFAASKIFGRLLGILITLTVLFYPLFLVQAGYLYTEIPGAAFFMCALCAWASRYMLISLIMAALACMVKSFGIVLISSLVILILFDKFISRKDKMIWVTSLIAVVIGIELFKFIFSSTLKYTLGLKGYLYYFISIFSTLNVVPDLKLLVTVALVMPWVFSLNWKSGKQVNAISAISNMVSGDISQRLLVSVYLVPIIFVGFIAAIPLSGTLFFPLLRYYIWILPLLLMGALYAGLLAIRAYRQNLPIASENKVLVVFLVGLIFFFSANRDGRYYPSLLESEMYSFSLVERSYEYIDFYKIKHDSVVSLAQLQKELPVFVTRGEYYFMSSPLMGYLKKKPRKIFLLVNKPYIDSNPSDFPDDFLMLDIPTRILHGGGVVKQILEKVRSDSNYAVEELAHHQVGPYKSTIYHISKITNPI